MERTRRRSDVQEGPQGGTVVFIHCPKTGGTSLNHILRENYGEEGFFRVPPGKWRRKDIPWNGPRCISGHMPWEVVNKIDGPVVVLTLLRHPVDRVLSLLRHMQQFENHKHRPSLKRLGTEKFLAEHRMAGLENGMIRWFSGREAGSSISRGPVTRDDLTLAWSRLQGAMVGFQEYFRDTVDQWAEVLGWTCTTADERYMATKRRRPPSDEELKVILDRNLLDLELYARALEYWRGD